MTHWQAQKVAREVRRFYATAVIKHMTAVHRNTGDVYMVEAGGHAFISVAKWDMHRHTLANMSDSLRVGQLQTSN